MFGRCGGGGVCCCFRAVACLLPGVLCWLRSFLYVRPCGSVCVRVCMCVWGVHVMLKINERSCFNILLYSKIDYLISKILFQVHHIHLPTPKTDRDLGITKRFPFAFCNPRFLSFCFHFLE